tara:strand:+ start:147928 stop:149667 length:1740 start_codon:yes stop_codon:yes gene_type:complete
MPNPDIFDKEFNNKIYKKFNKFEIPKKKKTFNQICYPKEFKLQPQQRFLGEYLNPKTPYKGLLVFHRIGAGKTCTAVRIAEAWKGDHNIIVVVPASLRGNFKSELRSLCAGSSYLKDNERKKLEELHPSTSEYKKIIKESDNRIDKYYKIYSYNKFVELVENNKMNLSKSILIIDEIQNMVSEGGHYYNTLYNAIYSAPRTLRVVALTATPMFDKPIEIALTMNLLKIPFQFPTGSAFQKMFIDVEKKGSKIKYTAKNLDIFKERIKGYISYYRGAPPYVFPEAKVRYVKCQMSNFQYRSYITVLAGEKKRQGIKKFKEKNQMFKEGTVVKLPNNFFIGTRLISNVAYPNKKINEKGFASWKGDDLNLKNLKKYSIKFYTIIKRIISSTGTSFVYCNFTEFGGILAFKKALEAQGFKDYMKDGEGWKRYAVLSGDENDQQKEEIKAVFNKTGNIKGQKIKVIIGSPSVAEGHSFKNCRNVHIMEPYWNQSKIDQIIGRAVRYCSHKALPSEKRNVKVYVYMSVHPNIDESIDEYIRRLAKRKDKLIKEFEHALKEVAIDCKLFKNANQFKDEEPIQCDF